jgi:hypothetical protein
MALLDSNFLAKSDFCVKTQGSGVITTRLQYKFSTGDSSTAIGLQDIDFSVYGYLFFVTQVASSPYDVTPSYDGNLWPFVFMGDPNDPDTLRAKRILNFVDFVRNNPIHVNKINIRATDPGMLPTQILVETPNIFEGDAGRQIIDVSSQKTAYQYQNNIVTIDNTDLFIGRNSNIKFNAAFSMAAQDFYDNPIYIDWFVDYYLSLEKALYKNLKNL